MRNQFKKILSFILTFIIVVIVNAQFGEFGSAVLIQKDAIGTYYNLSGSGSNLIGNSFFTGNLGTFTQNSGKVSIKGAEIKTWKEYSANVCGATLYYIVYKENERPSSPVFNSFALPWKENCSGSSYPTGGSCSNPRDQKWSESNQNINLTNLSPANYILEVYISYNGSVNIGNGCETIYYIGNYGNNYKMNFTIASAGNGSSNISMSSGENYIYSRTYLEPTQVTDDSKKKIEAITYFDGLGRPKQTIAIKASPLGNDLVTPIEYDEFGRQTKNYLPLPQSSSGNGMINTSPETTYYTNNFPGARLYSEKKLELSPLDRLQEQGHPGTDWNIGSAHTQKIEYDLNDATLDKVKLFKITTAWQNNSYNKISTIYVHNLGSNVLYKNKVTDEDGNVTYEFKNGLGQTILVRKNDSTEDADTYYVYNEYSQLVLVIPPLASKVFKNYTGATLIPTDPIIQNLCYLYNYDVSNRLVEKKLPGKGWEYMVYDKQDRLVASQDANMRVNNQWLFTKYDLLGRVAYTGINTGGARTVEQASADSALANYVERKSDVSFTQNGLGVYYGNPTGLTTYPSGISTLLSVNYYDTYPAGTPSIAYQLISQNDLLTDNFTVAKNTKGLATANFIKNIENDSWTKNYSWYDQKGRAVSTYSQNHLGGYTRTETELDFSGTPQKSYAYHKRLSTDTEIAIKERFEYDNQKRLVKHFHQVNTNTEELLTNNEYNELGQLKNKKVGGNATTPIQTVDYKYNIRGWMTQINDPANLGTDLFGFEIKYQNPDINKSSPTAKYNGNISQTTWATKNDEIIRTYTYQYDKLNRLTDARLWDQMNLDMGEYQESLSYDLNGNISTLYRTGAYPYSGATAPEMMDDLQYNYASNTNKLTSLKEKGAGNRQSGYPLAAGQTGQTITYDDNGNMISQGDKGITTIKYNHLNLPTEIIGTESIYGSNGVPTTYNITTKYIYNAAGEKLRKEYTYFDRSYYYYKTITTDYLNGFQYEGGRDTQFSAVKLKFFPTAEGYVTNNQPIYESGQNLNNISYIYQYKDHLGNARVSYANSYYISEENNYYPFGLKHTGYNNDGGSPTYQYKYNGKELQETGMYDYGARFYMPDIGRWGVVDPLAEKYANLSPYIYVADNPINAIDPDGKVIIFINGQHAGDGGNRSYWNGLDQKIANRFQDYHARYYDGALGGWKNTVATWGFLGTSFGTTIRMANTRASVRKREGMAMGYKQAGEIYKGLAEGETIKIATHSMGGAYGKGFVKGLKKYAKENGLDNRIERVLDLATYQGSSLNAEKGILNEQVAHTNDGVAGVSRIDGVSDSNFHETRQNNKTGMLSEHSVDSFTQQEINSNTNPGNPSTAQPSQDKKIIVDHQQTR